MGWLSSPDPSTSPAQSPTPKVESLTQVSRANARNISSPTPGQLHPQDILFYSLIHSHIICKCGAEMLSSRLWICYGTEKRNETRPLGLSESIYANIRINEHFEPHYGTPACGQCIDGVAFEQWKHRSAPTGNSNFTASPGASAPSTTSKPKPSTKPSPSIDDLLNSM